MKVSCREVFIFTCISAVVLGCIGMASDPPGSSGVGRGLYYMTTSQYDEDNDGVFDTFSTSTHFYDHRGLRVLVITKTNSDSDPDIDLENRTTFTHDRHGNMLTVLQEIDPDGDGPDTFHNQSTTAYTYGQRDLVMQIVNDSNLYPGPAIHVVSDYTYNKRGHLVSISSLRTYETGIVATTTTRTNNAQGNALVEVIESDNGNDGSVEQVSTRYSTWNPRFDVPLTTRMEIDFLADGSIDYVQATTNEFNARGWRIKETIETDTDNDGTANNVQVTTFEYDQRGNIVGRIVLRDLNNDGVFDNKTVMQFYY